MADTTLKVIVDLKGQGDLSAVLRQQQAQVEKLNRAEAQNNELKREAVAAQKQSLTNSAAMVAAQVVATRAAVSGISQQVRATRQLEQVQRSAAVVARQAAGLMMAPGGAGRAERKESREALAEHLAGSASAAVRARQAFAARAHELLPRKHGAELRGGLETAYRQEAALAPVQELLRARDKRLDVNTQRKMLEGGPGFRRGNTFGKDITEALRENVMLSRDQANLDVMRAGLSEQIVRSEEFRAAAYARTRAASAEDANRLRESAIMAKERAHFLASPQGKAALREQAMLQRQIATAEGASRWRERVAEQGRFAAAVGVTSERLKSVREGLREVGTAATWAFVGATAAIGGMVNAASPAHWQTLTKSFQLLSATVGQEFLPYIDQVSLYLQQTARWVNSLDDATKAGYARWALYGVGILGVVAILPRMIALLRGVAVAAQLASVAVSFASANPVTALVGLGVAVGGVATAYYLLSQNANQAGEAMANATKRASIEDVEATTAKIQTGRAREAELMRPLPPAWQEALKEARGEPEKAKALLQQVVTNTQADMERRQAEQGRYGLSIQAAFEKAQAGRQRDLTPAEAAEAAKRYGSIAEPGQLKYRFRLEEAQKVFEEELRKGGIDRHDRSEVEGMFRPGTGAEAVGLSRDNVDVAKLERLRESATRDLAIWRQQQEAAKKMLEGGFFGNKPGVGGPEGLMRSTAGLLPQPSYVGIGQLQERFQLQALSGEGDLDKKLKQDQLENLKGILVEIKELRRDIQHQVPVWGP